MNQDNALKKILEAREKEDLPYDFESRLMKKIMLEAKKKKRRSTVFNLCLVSFVSLSMMVSTYLILKYYLWIDLSLPKNPFKFSSGSASLFGFFFYIAFLVLILLGLDMYFRKLKQKSETN